MGGVGGVGGVTAPDNKKRIAGNLIFDTRSLIASTSSSSSSSPSSSSSSSPSCSSLKGFFKAILFPVCSWPSGGMLQGCPMRFRFISVSMVAPVFHPILLSLLSPPPPPCGRHFSTQASGSSSGFLQGSLPRPFSPSSRG